MRLHTPPPPPKHTHTHTHTQVTKQYIYAKANTKDSIAKSSNPRSPNHIDHLHYIGTKGHKIHQLLSPSKYANSLEGIAHLLCRV